MTLIKYFFSMYVLCVSVCLGTETYGPPIEIYGPPTHIFGTNPKAPIPNNSAIFERDVMLKLSLLKCPESYRPTGELQEAGKYDDASTWYTAHFCLSMWKRTMDALLKSEDLGNLGNLGKQCQFNWDNRRPLFIRTWIPESSLTPPQKNAFYNPTYSFLIFTYNSLTNTDYMCRSFSTVAHETGHAFLDVVKPDLLYSNSEYAKALHESFGDITAIMAAMRVAIINGQYDKVIDSLYNDSITQIIIVDNICIRHASNNIGWSNFECHNMSESFTNFFVEMIKSSFVNLQTKDQKNLIDLLKTYRGHFLASILAIKPDNGGVYSNGLLVKVGENFTSRISCIYKFDQGILPKYFQQFSQHVDIPEIYHNHLTIPVAGNSFKGDHQFADSNTWQ